MRVSAVLLAAIGALLLPAHAQAASGAYDNYLAPTSACPGNDVLTIVASEQVASMLCLIDYARSVRGIPAVTHSPLLAASAGAKADDIVRCDDFSHTACGRAVDQTFKDSGYAASDVSWDIGENLAFGVDVLGSPRSIMRAWLESTEHRENIFAEQWRDQGVALRKPPVLFGLTSETVWVSHFGRREATPGVPPSGNDPTWVPGTGTALNVSVRPSRARKGRRTRFRFVVTAVQSGARRPVMRATVSFGGRRTVTDSRGRATIAIVPRKRGRLRAKVTKQPSLRATATVRVIGG